MIEYGLSDALWWQGDAACFHVIAYGKKVLCRVSAEAIDDHYGDSPDNGARLDKAKINFDQISDKVGHKVAVGNFEADGSILLRTLDW